MAINSNNSDQEVMNSIKYSSSKSNNDGITCYRY